MPVRNGENDGLYWSEPQGKRAGVVLDQERDEPFEAPDDRAVYHDGTMLGVVRADVLQIEVLGLHVIELDRRALPLPADGVHDVEVDLRPVERAILFVDVV